MLISLWKREAYSQLPTRTPSSQEKPLGELSPPLKRRRNRRDPGTLAFLRGTKLRWRESSTDTAMRYFTLLTANSSLNLLTLKLGSSTTKSRETITDICPNTPPGLNTTKPQIRLMRLTSLPLKMLRLPLRPLIQSDSVLPSTIPSSTMRLKTTQARPANCPNKPSMMLLLISIKLRKTSTRMPPP